MAAGDREQRAQATWQVVRLPQRAKRWPRLPTYFLIPGPVYAPCHNPPSPGALPGAALGHSRSGDMNGEQALRDANFVYDDWCRGWEQWAAADPATAADPAEDLGRGWDDVFTLAD